ncbi:hypothetical protein ES288_A07G112100v1 [Gossypium darwinii]|uniref:Uncharacterized protein n=1 Tax=Gossypium darwinii TaxID=34276 RepID=A0A5D2FVI7_GOSDA|nr:hypothetical protein ES288_A07G112100v1 [Gossypium darwinii]
MDGKCTDPTPPKSRTLRSPSRRRRDQWPALHEKDSLAPFQVNPKGCVPKEVHEPSPFNRKETKERIPTPFQPRRRRRNLRR